jgi:N4-gp56 family major capsid protein
MPAATPATGATEFIDRTTADVFIPEIWSGDALIERESQLVFGNLIDRRLESQLSVGDTIHVPSISNLGAARTKTTNGAVTFVTVTETMAQAGDDGFDGVTVTVTTHDYNAIAVESIAKLQTNRDLMSAYASKMGYSLALAFDDVIAGYVDNFSNTVGALAVELNPDDVLDAIQSLDDADVPQNERYMVVSPAQAIAFLKYDRHVHKDYESVHGMVEGKPGLDRSYVTSILDVPIWKSTNVEGTNSAGHDNGLFHKEAITAIMQMSPTSHSAFDIDYLADKIVMEQVYGSSEQRDDHGVFAKGL